MRVTALLGSLLPAAFTLAFAAATPAVAQPAPPDTLTRRLGMQNSLFEAYWQKELELSPTMATAVGDYRYNDKLGDSSLAAVAQRHQLKTMFLAPIKAISTDGFSE